jgi:hypothetical protein
MGRHDLFGRSFGIRGEDRVVVRRSDGRKDRDERQEAAQALDH